ncbi:DNA (cytosine-5-)-methyltransferase [Pyruvatibacter mobilis]|uniref:Cytosine-specific methyltransferase n=1 Tax=Pyruvatibacter mobilis TaxID=1712261 RepID=A0A845QC90_9HYPH|nr:DNA cytosine methyltransferase [Pyruvatibacter mobilis]NBG95641.1 DNA (cytosine-5-)-methyltransferase [Pyruvatibacter mobilis]QJD75289.1 DNA cytosine methyltransferase [Pyruvatibacter mobilis]
MHKFYEFFAGGGMVRAGLGEDWKCVFANDFDRKKGITYKKNWGDGELIVDDIRNISLDDLPGCADLVWGSFPCQDLSLAGGGAGLRGDRSGTFWPFIAQLEELKVAGRAPTVVALENVVGTLTSHKGADFIAICEALDNLGYQYGAFVADAAHFVPQSRPRLFVIAVKKSLEPMKTGAGPMAPWHTAALKKAHNRLPEHLKKHWLWWHMPKPLKRLMRLADVIEAKPASVKWHTAAETRALLSMMSDVNLAKVETAKAAGVVMVGGVYKRTRYHHGIKVQRAEVRFDDVAGCLRTPAGGSSRQLILVVDGERIRSRLISTRETARLMGLPDSYKLPEAYNEAYHLTGDGVAVPVVRYIAQHILEPVVKGACASRPAEKVPTAKAT